MAVIGIKHDTGKPRAGLMLGDFGLALSEVAQVTTFGALKYSPGNWRLVERGPERYADALCRHLLAALPNLQAVDTETGLRELAHVAWNALALLELTRNQASKSEGQP